MISKKEKFKSFLNLVFNDINQAINKATIDPELIQVCNSVGETVFHFIVIENRIDLAKSLLLAGSDINTTDELKVSPLMHAVELNYMEMTKWLIESGANLDMRDEDGNTALSYSTRNELGKIFDYLIKIPRKKAIDYYYPDIEAVQILKDNSLVMREELVKLGLSRRF